MFLLMLVKPYDILFYICLHPDCVGEIITTELFHQSLLDEINKPENGAVAQKHLKQQVKPSKVSYQISANFFCGTRIDSGQLSILCYRRCEYGLNVFSFCLAPLRSCRV